MGRKQSGVSLVEVLVVVSIIAGLSAYIITASTSARGFVADFGRAYTKLADWAESESDGVPEDGFGFRRIAAGSSDLSVSLAEEQRSSIQRARELAESQRSARGSDRTFYNP